MPDDIFISYRRDDSADVVDRIEEQLVGVFSRKRVFRDIDSIPPGVDFREHVQKALGGCRVMLVIIGAEWLKVADAAGQRRIDQPEDIVRLEIESALAAPRTVVLPVLVRGASMPKPEELPASLVKLAYQNATPVRRNPDFAGDMERLLAELRSALRMGERPRFGPGLAFVSGALAALMVVFVSAEKTLPMFVKARQAIFDRLGGAKARPVGPPLEAVQRWKEQILAQQIADGGIRVHLGGETQAWSTAQCLKAILASPLPLDAEREKIVAAFQYLEKSRNAELDGWGDFGDNNFTVTEITAWVCLANLELFTESRAKTFAAELPAASERLQRDLTSLLKRRLKEPAGAWSPVAMNDPRLARTYSTVMAVWTLAEAKAVPELQGRLGPEFDEALDAGVTRLLENFKPGSGLAAADGLEPDPPLAGLDAQALFALHQVEKARPYWRSIGKSAMAKKAGLSLFGDVTNIRERDQLSGAVTDLRPTNYKLESSSFLRFPWALLATSVLQRDSALFDTEQTKARDIFRDLAARSIALDEYLRTAENWEVAECLYCVSRAIANEPGAAW